jgi:hypothetical protein
MVALADGNWVGLAAYIYDSGPWTVLPAARRARDPPSRLTLEAGDLSARCDNPVGCRDGKVGWKRFADYRAVRR